MYTPRARIRCHTDARGAHPRRRVHRVSTRIKSAIIIRHVPQIIAPHAPIIRRVVAFCAEAAAVRGRRGWGRGERAVPAGGRSTAILRSVRVYGRAVPVGTAEPGTERLDFEKVKVVMRDRKTRNGGLSGTT